MLDPSDGIAVFTDGSCNSGDGSGGWAWVALDTCGAMVTHSGHYSRTTNNKMELYAPTHALNWLHNEFGPSDVLVYSDSEYVVLGVQDKTRARRVNKPWWIRLDEAEARHNYVEWSHVKGHSDSLYNGLADKLAGQARKEGLILNGLDKRMAED